jgi:hypothetical protein
MDLIELSQKLQEPFRKRLLHKFAVQRPQACGDLALRGGAECWVALFTGSDEWTGLKRAAAILGTQHSVPLQQPLCANLNSRAEPKFLRNVRNRTFVAEEPCLRPRA